MSTLRLLLTFIALAPALAQAQASRTWLAGVGDDANPCSRTAPCRTLAAAATKTAAGGEIDSLMPGGYGSVVLTKSMTIDGRGGKNSRLSAAPGTDVVVIDAGATGVVTLRKLHIEGTGGGRHGVRVVGAKHVVIEDCVISGFTGAGILVEAPGAQLMLTNVLVRDNGDAGVILNAANASAVARNSSFNANGDGFRVTNGGHATLYDNMIAGNAAAGIVADASEVNVERATLSGNATGVRVTGAEGVARVSTLRITGSTGSAIEETTGGKVLSFGNNHIPDQTTVLAPARAVTETQLGVELLVDRSLELSSRVQAPSGAPTGMIAFHQGGTQLGVEPLVDGKAVFTLPGLAPGTYAFTATYQGDELFAPSASATTEFTVQAADGGTNPGDGGVEPPTPEEPTTGCGCTGATGSSGLVFALAAFVLMRRSTARS